MIVVGDHSHHDREQLNMEGGQKGSEGDEERNRKINWRHFFIVCSVLISAYLINGEYAQTVCNICTTVPAAIFTYGQLSDHATRVFAYKATLFYWSIHGILVAFDSIFVDAFGYFFGKFILLVVLFFNVVYQHDNAKSLMEQQQQQRRNAMSNSIVSTRTPVPFPTSPYGSQIGVNTALTITDATQLSAESPFKSHRSLHYNNLATAYSLAHSPEMTAYLDTSYTHDGSLKTVAPTEKQYEFGIYQQTAPNNSSVLSDSAEENDHSENDAVKSIPAGDCQEADNEGDDLPQYSPSTMVMKEDEGTLITNPDEYIVFNYPFSETVTVYVKNKHNCPIMWALKTNAIKRIIAQPTCGTLGKDATVHIKIGVKAAPSKESKMNDRIAIDYCLIDDDTVGFDRSFLYNTEDPFRRRKKFNIYYKN
ncbi:MSP (Major sperm protein) domain family protein [Acanthocheilonema viteae]